MPVSYMACLYAMEIYRPIINIRRLGNRPVARTAKVLDCNLEILADSGSLAAEYWNFQLARS